MKTVIDTHLHYYRFYDTKRFLSSLAGNLSRIAPGCEKAGVVPDRAGLKGFELLVESAQGMDGVEFVPAAGELRYSSAHGLLHIYRGIQVACRERFEVLGLFCSDVLEDGIPAKEAVERIIGQGGIPVVAWAPGKWMFGRRALVEQLLRGVDPEKVFIGDTFFRPAFWAEPVLIREFRRSGGRVLCGSDPLPIAGQEAVAGCYASVVEMEQLVPAQIIKGFSAAGGNLACLGSRAGAVHFVRCMAKIVLR